MCSNTSMGLYKNQIKPRKINQRHMREAGKNLLNLHWRIFATKVSSPQLERTVNIRSHLLHVSNSHLESLTFKCVFR